MALRPLFRCTVYYRATHLNESLLTVKLALRAHVGDEWRAEKLHGKKMIATRLKTPEKSASKCQRKQRGGRTWPGKTIKYKQVWRK